MYKLNSGGADASGNASVISEKIARGKLLAVHLIYDSSSASATDVTLSMLGSDYGGADATLLSISNNNTSGWYYPRTYAEDYQGNDLTFDGTNKIPCEAIVFGRLKLSVAQQTATKAVKAYVFVEEY